LRRAPSSPPGACDGDDTAEQKFPGERWTDARISASAASCLRAPGNRSSVPLAASATTRRARVRASARPDRLGSTRGRGGSGGAQAWRVMDGVPMVGAMSSSRWEAATKLTRRLLLPTPESPMRRILKEHSWPPPLLPAPGDPIPPLGFRPIRRRSGAGRNAGPGPGPARGRRGGGIEARAGSGQGEKRARGASWADSCVVVLALTGGEALGDGWSSYLWQAGRERGKRRALGPQARRPAECRARRAGCIAGGIPWPDSGCFGCSAACRGGVARNLPAAAASGSGGAGW